MNTVLIAEDEPSIAGLIKLCLSQSGYECTVAKNGLEAADLIEQKDFDIALLDIMMPGADGYELLEYLRPTGTPAIFITAKGELDDRVRGLSLGADDYIVKPFETRELVARVETVLRRTGRGGKMLYAFGVEADTHAHTVTKNGEQVHLTPLEYTLLEQLMRSRGAALYRDVLYNRVWGGDMEDDTRTLDLHIKRLRQKFDWTDKIITVYKVGYMLKSEDMP